MMLLEVSNKTMSSTLSIRINSKTKKAAQKTLQALGLDLSAGVKMFLEQVVATESLPFYAATKTGHKLRHWELYKREIAEAKKNGKFYRTAEEAFADILEK